jgi:spore germination cell wall hydrolase CwlJ-like protein
VLARDIYRDLYEEPGPTRVDNLLLAAKRLGVVVAGCALVLGGLDFAGIHQIPGLGTFMQSARTKVAANHKTPPAEARVIVHDAVRVEVPKMAAVKREASPSVVDALVAEGRKDALSMAMTSSTLVLPALAPPATKSSPATPVVTAASLTPPPAPVAEKPLLPAAPVSVAGASVEKPTPTAVPSQLKRVTPAAAPMIELTEAAAKSQASVPANAEIQLASLPNPDAKQDAPAVAAASPIMIPLSEVPLPRPAPPMSPAERLNLKGKDYARAERCLANAIYFEARSEPIRGQMAVAQVVINRAFSGFYPNDVCGVVYQNASRHLACQFTFACDGKSKAITERHHWAVANRIARQTLDGQIYVPEVGKSTHYHAAYVRPNWAREMKKLVRFGLHSFYRPYAWGNGADEPVWGTSTVASVVRVHKTASR